MYVRYCAECMGNAKAITAQPLPSRANGPGWTKHTQDLFCHSAEIDGHKDRVPNSVLAPGDASMTIRPNSLNHSETEYSGERGRGGSNYSSEYLKTSPCGLYLEACL